MWSGVSERFIYGFSTKFMASLKSFLLYENAISCNGLKTNRLSQMNCSFSSHSLRFNWIVRQQQKRRHYYSKVSENRKSSSLMSMRIIAILLRKGIKCFVRMHALKDEKNSNCFANKYINKHKICSTFGLNIWNLNKCSQKLSVIYRTKLLSETKFYYGIKNAFLRLSADRQSRTTSEMSEMSKFLRVSKRSFQRNSREFPAEKLFSIEMGFNNFNRVKHLTEFWWFQRKLRTTSVIYEHLWCEPSQTRSVANAEVIPI